MKFTIGKLRKSVTSAVSKCGPSFSSTLCYMSARRPYRTCGWQSGRFLQRSWVLWACTRFHRLSALLPDRPAGIAEAKMLGNRVLFPVGEAVVGFIQGGVQHRPKIQLVRLRGGVHRNVLRRFLAVLIVLPVKIYSAFIQRAYRNILADALFPIPVSSAIRWMRLSLQSSPFRW